MKILYGTGVKAEKKTAKEIGEILGVSTRSVFSYYKECYSS